MRVGAPIRRNANEGGGTSATANLPFIFYELQVTIVLFIDQLRHKHDAGISIRRWHSLKVQKRKCIAVF